MISATVAGNVGQAELKDVRGESVLSFSIASNSKAGGEKVTTWVRCSLWGKRARALADYITQGSSVAASGTLSLRTYEGKNGAGTSLELNVSEVALLGGKRDGGGGRRDDEPRRGGGGRDDGDDYIPF